MRIKAKRRKRIKEKPGMTKQDMYDLYGDFGMLTVRYRMRDIIMESRNIDEKHSGYVKTLYDSEANKVINSFA
jgi:hypothetical protein